MADDWGSVEGVGQCSMTDEEGRVGLTKKRSKSRHLPVLTIRDERVSAHLVRPVESVIERREIWFLAAVRMFVYVCVYMCVCVYALDFLIFQPL